jgi:hypothetical protein
MGETYPWNVDNTVRNHYTAKHQPLRVDADTPQAAARLFKVRTRGVVRCHVQSDRVF